MIYAILTVLILFLAFRDWQIVRSAGNRSTELQQANAELLTKLCQTQLDLANLQSKQQSKSVRLGLITENVLPFHKDFPYDYKGLVPMFRPIDYIHFAEDKITFIEIKMGTSKMSPKQKNIARLIREGKVEFVEYRISEEGLNAK